MDSKAGKTGDHLKPITVRFSPEARDAIRDFAAEHGVSQAEIVRMAAVGNLYRYFGDIRFIDPEQGAEIKRCVMALLDTVSKIHTELNRIGVNYNQEIRLKQIERRYAGRHISYEDAMRRGDEEREVMNECAGFSRAELDALMTRYEQATKQVGDILCRILT